MSAVRNADTLDLICSRLETNAGDIARACAEHNVSTGWLKRWMRDDPKVDAAIRDAMDTGTAVLESALIKRAVDGYEEPVFYKDEIVGYKTKFSDSNLQFALSARKREVYGKTIDINQNISVTHLSDKELDAKIEMLSAKLGLTLALPAPGETIDAEFEDVREEIAVDDLL